MEWGEWRNQTHPASPCSPLPIALFWRVHSAIALHAASQCPLEQEELAFDQASDHLAETLAQTRFARDIKLCSAKNHYRKCRRRGGGAGAPAGGPRAPRRGDHASDHLA